MSYRIYLSGNMVVLLNTDYKPNNKRTSTWRVEKLPRNQVWYEYNPTDAPIVYSLYYDHPERDLILDAQYGEFQKSDGSGFADDATLQAYLDATLGSGPENYALSAARGDVLGVKTLNKFGRAVSGVQSTTTDIWDRADATPTQQIWLAPTAARIHTIASTDAQDTTGGTGVNTVIISYLPDWDTKETTETVTGDLNAGIPMLNAAVMIHRMKTVPQATTADNNVGIITATAATDGTVTAQILALEGQTQMAIYGIPSTQTLYLDDIHGSINKSSGSAATINFKLVVNPNPNVQTVSFLIKNTRGVQSTGTSSEAWNFTPPYKIAGPAIIKMQGIASTSDVEGSAGFDGYIVDNV